MALNAKANSFCYYLTKLGDFEDCLQFSIFLPEFGSFARFIKYCSTFFIEANDLDTLEYFKK